MSAAVGSGIVTGDVLVSYWPIFFPVPRRGRGGGGNPGARVMPAREIP